MAEKKDKDAKKDAEPRSGRKPYVAPVLLSFGSLTLLTGKAFAMSIT